MGIDGVLLFLMILTSQGAFGGGGSITPEQARREADAARRRAEDATRGEQSQRHAQALPPAWPVATPAGLPPFPSGWEYAEPPSPAIHTRAYQLLDSLWSRGSGSTSQEMTGGEWITYRAETVRGGKKGVVAYRTKHPIPPGTAHVPQQLPTQATRSPGLPQPAPGAATHALPPTQSRSPGLPQPAPAAAAPELSPLHAAAVHPLLHQGSGMGILAAQAPAVRDLQIRLHVMPADGKFGANTRESVITFQRSHGLNPDGVVGPNTWSKLDEASPMAWNLSVGPARLLV